MENNMNTQKTKAPAEFADGRAEGTRAGKAYEPRKLPMDPVADAINLGKLLGMLPYGTPHFPDLAGRWLRSCRDLVKICRYVRRSGRWDEETREAAGRAILRCRENCAVLAGMVIREYEMEKQNEDADPAVIRKLLTLSSRILDFYCRF